MFEQSADALAEFDARKRELAACFENRKQAVTRVYIHYCQIEGTDGADTILLFRRHDGPDDSVANFGGHVIDVEIEAFDDVEAGFGDRTATLNAC